MNEPGSSIHAAQSAPSPSPEKDRDPSASGSGVERLPVRPDLPTVITNRPPRTGVLPITEAAARILQGRITPGDRLGHFELAEYIGGGGMGRVFRAFDTRLARDVALKILSHEQAADEETRLRFQNEAQSAARLDHENIARVFYVGEDHGLQYIVFEYIEGINVRDLVQRKGPLPLAEAIGYTLQVAEALAHAADRAVVHRDIKPSNVLITKSGTVKLIDMGLARLRQVDAEVDLTASGVTLGTFDYISPEQARDPRSADVRSDIYSLGCTLFFMLTGQPPFPVGTVLQKLLQHQGDQPPDVRDLRHDLPEEVSRLLRKMLAKDPRHRPGTPAALIEDLLYLAQQLGIYPAVMSGRAWLDTPTSRTPRWRRSLPWALPAVILAVVVGVLHILPVWQILEQSPPKPRLTEGNSASRLDGSPPGAIGRASRVEPVDRPVATHSDEDVPSDVSKAGTESATIVGNQGDSRSGLGLSTSSAGAEATALPTDAPQRLPAQDQPRAASAEAPSTGSLPTVPSSLGPRSVADESGPAPHSTASPAQVASSGQGRASAEPTRPGVLVVAPGASGDRHYASLAAACAAAEDGDVIELRYDGPREERPIHIVNTRLTIRAAEGFQPVILYRPQDPDALRYPRSMISISGGYLTLVQVRLELDLRSDMISDGWTLIETVGRQSVRLEQCVLTIRNGTGRGGLVHPDAAFLRTRATPQARILVDEYERVESLPASIVLEDTIVRGDATMWKAEAAQPVQLDWENGLLAISEPLLTVEAAPARPAPGDELQLDLRHLTAAVHGGLCTWQTNAAVPFLLPLHVDCSDCIFFGGPAHALMECEEEEPAESLRHRVDWNGERNFFQGFTSFWTDRRPGNPAAVQTMTFEQWMEYWGPRHVNFCTIAPVARKQPPSSNQPIDTWNLQDFLLSEQVDNPAVNAASDGRDAGMIADRLPVDPPKVDGPGAEGRAGVSQATRP